LYIDFLSFILRPGTSRRLLCSCRSHISSPKSLKGFRRKLVPKDFVLRREIFVTVHFCSLKPLLSSILISDFKTSHKKGNKFHFYSLRHIQRETINNFVLQRWALAFTHALRRLQTGDSQEINKKFWKKLNTYRSSELLLPLTRTVILCFGTRRNSLPNYCSFQNHLYI
jgi:hypothetical protein